MTPLHRRAARALLLAALVPLAPALAQRATPRAASRTALTTPMAELPLGVTGTIRFHADFPSRHVAARHVEVWLPPGYERDARTRYPVLYMHDGQNVFVPSTSYTKIDWGVDEAMTRLVAAGRVRPAIVVAVWNSPLRFQEYMPRKAVGEARIDSVLKAWQAAGSQGSSPDLLSDRYLRFLVEELKPYVDRTYRTRTGAADTFIMGSSMGGLISCYALAEYPRVFGGAGCISTHWPIAEGATIDYFRTALPAPGRHRVWFDHGTATLDSLYPPLQARMDSAMRARGWTAGRDWVTRAYPGAEHSERAWRARIEDPLVFLLGRERAR